MPVTNFDKTRKIVDDQAEVSYFENNRKDAIMTLFSRIVRTLWNGLVERPPFDRVCCCNIHWANFR